MARTRWTGSGTHSASLDHLKLRPLGGARRRAGGRGSGWSVGGIGIGVPLGENHALAGLARVNTEYGPHRDQHREPHAAEAGFETHVSIAELQHLRRREADVQDNLAV